MSKISNGRSLQPASGAAPRQIILLLHGYGSNGADLIAMAGAWQHLFPEALFLAPNAPMQLGRGEGFQWWPLESFSPQALAAGAKSAAPAVDAFIDRKLDQYGLSESDLALVGFSQGTMMALQVGLRRKRPVAAIVGYSGSLVGADDLADEIASTPPILLVHGSDDPVVPVAALHAAQAALAAAGVDVATHISPGLGHSVDETGLRLGAEFLAARLSGR